MSDSNILYSIWINEWYCRFSSCNMRKQEQCQYKLYFWGFSYISICYWYKPREMIHHNILAFFYHFNIITNKGAKFVQLVKQIDNPCAKISYSWPLKWCYDFLMASACSNLKVAAPSPKQMESGYGNRNGQKSGNGCISSPLYLAWQLLQYIQFTSWQLLLLFLTLNIKNACTPSSLFTSYI